MTSPTLRAAVRRTARATGRTELEVLALMAERLDAEIAAATDDSDELARLIAARAGISAEIDRAIVRGP